MAGAASASTSSSSPPGVSRPRSGERTPRRRGQARDHLCAGQGADATFVVGVNDDTFDPASDFVVSAASCTTNCLVPMVKVLDDAFGLAPGLDDDRARLHQRPVRARPRSHNLRRARAAAVNIIPSTTALPGDESRAGVDERPPRRPVAAGARAGRLDHRSHGHPRCRGGGRRDQRGFQGRLTDRALAGILVYNTDEIVSSDIVGSSASCTFDSTLTMTIAIDESTTLAKVLGWYDNEWGYSNRLVDLAKLIGAA